MDAGNRKSRNLASPDDLPKALPDFRLHHGQAVWLLTELGFRGASTQSTFYEYVKSLRRLGIPFEAGKIGHAHRGLANYSYNHLMELALALTLRVYQVVPDSVLVGIIRYRKRLYRHYRQAYSARCSGRGEPIIFETDGSPPIRMRGIFLDLQLNFSGGRLVKFGPPKSLSPYQAVSAFAACDHAGRALLPIGLSFLSERTVALALRAPLIRRGPRPATTRSDRSRKGRGAAQSPESGQTA
jgi:hypothetical protein